jgi:hypothetical protein
MLRWSDADLATIEGAAGTDRGAFADFVRAAALKAARRARKPEPLPEPQTSSGPAPIEVEVAPAIAPTETPADAVLPVGWASELLTH